MFSFSMCSGWLAKEVILCVGLLKVGFASCVWRVMGVSLFDLLIRWIRVNRDRRIELICNFCCIREDWFTVGSWMDEMMMVCKSVHWIGGGGDSLMTMVMISIQG
jgi:hypothetical protein